MGIATMFSDTFLEQLPTQPLRQLDALCEKLQLELERLGGLFAWRAVAALCQGALLILLFLFTMAMVFRLTGSARFANTSGVLWFSVFLGSGLCASASRQLRHSAQGLYEDILSTIALIRLHLRHFCAPVELPLDDANLFAYPEESALELRWGYFAQAWHLTALKTATRQLRAAIKASPCQLKRPRDDEPRSPLHAGAAAPGESDDAQSRRAPALVEALAQAVRANAALGERHQALLLDRLEALRQEALEKTPSLPTAFALMGVVGIVLGQHGEAPQPLMAPLLEIAATFQPADARADSVGTAQPPAKPGPALPASTS